MAVNILRLFQTTNPDKPLGGRYKIVGELGAGGFGQTFLAEDIHLPGQPRCVVKQLKPQVTDAESLQTARRLFDTEAKVLYQLGNHDQIPRLLAHFEDNEEFYLAQELIEGETIKNELISGQPWPESKVIALLQDLLQVLAFVHQQQVIHRDIKPPNLIRRRCDRKIVLIDFGAVKQVSTQLVNPKTGRTNMTISIGTQGYMPKEQLGGQPRFSSDVYAAGMIGIQALTGIHPRSLNEDPHTGEINWHEYAKSVTPELTEVLDRMVRYDFRTRYVTAAQALEALQSLPKDPRDSAAFPQSWREEVEAYPSEELEPASTIVAPLSESLSKEVEAEEAQPPSTVLASLSSNTSSEAVPDSQLPTVVAAGLENHKPVSTSGPTVFVPGWSVKKLLKPLYIVTALATMGAVILTIKVFLPSQPATQTSSSKNVPTGQSDTTPATDPKKQATELLSQANKEREDENYREAIATYDQVIDLNPEIAEAHWGRCYSLNVLGEAEEAIAACDRALEIKPDYPEALWSKGAAFEQQKKYPEALALYDQTIEINPEFAEAWNNRGVTLLSLERDNEALAAFDKATNIKPDFADAWANRGAALWKLKQLDEAIASMEKALEIDPDHPNANDLRQQARQQIGR